jgi:ABC-2 type transport system ATP-binding protein
LVVRRLVRDLATAGKTVLLSTHILQEVEAIADRLVIINQGRIVGNGTLEELRQELRQYERTSLSVAAPREAVEAALKTLPGLLEVRSVHSSDDYAAFDVRAVAGTGLSRQLGNLFSDKGWRVGELHVQPPTLEETFLALTAPPASDEAPAAHVC